MAQFSTDFSEYATGSAPSDWTAQWVTTNVTWTVQAGGDIGTNVLRAAVSSAGRHALSWDDALPPSGVNAEVLVKFRQSAIAASGAGAGPVYQGAGSGGSETGYWDDCSTTQVRHIETSGGTAGVNASASFVISADTWYWLRGRIGDDDDLGKCKVWADGDPEPGSYTAAATDSTKRSAGWAGVVAIPVGTHEFDYISIGTDGDPAPDPVVVAASGSGSLMLLGVG